MVFFANLQSRRIKFGMWNQNSCLNTFVTMLKKPSVQGLLYSTKQVVKDV